MHFPFFFTPLSSLSVLGFCSAYGVSRAFYSNIARAKVKRFV
jgi:hypothetical protein